MAAHLHPQPLQAILLLGGAFNPVHNGHIQTLVQIKQFLETKQNYKIISAFCVISTDRYVFGKYKKSNSKAMTFAHRQKMVNLATSKYPWIFASDFECTSAAMYGELIVHEKEYKKYFHKQNGNNINKKQLKNIKRINCMGADKILTTKEVGIWTFIANIQNPNTMNIAIGRDGYMDNAQKLYDEDLKNGKIDTTKFLLINSLNVPSISSTQIRIPLLELYKKIYINIISEGDQKNEQMTDEKKDHADINSVEELKIIFKNATKQSLSQNVTEYLLNHLKDIWITEDYFEKKKQMFNKSNKNSAKKSKSWFAGIKWKKT